MIHEFGWGPADWNKLAAGIVGGHAIECGAQATGGNCQVDWESIPDLADIGGYPILEVGPDGSFVFTKHAGTGGRITVASVKEQLLYEIGDPRAYITPDCVADFTTIQMEEAGPDRVSFHGIEGRPATDTYKVSISHSAGFRATGWVAYAWPDAYRKAQAWRLHPAGAVGPPGGCGSMPCGASIWGPRRAMKLPPNLRLSWPRNCRR